MRKTKIMQERRKSQIGKGAANTQAEGAEFVFSAEHFDGGDDVDKSPERERGEVSIQLIGGDPLHKQKSV